MECLLARLIKTKFWWLFNFQLSCRFNHNKQSRPHFIWKTLLKVCHHNFCFLLIISISRSSQNSPPLHCWSVPTLNVFLPPFHLLPSLPLSLPSSPSPPHYPPQWSFIQKEELREQDWCSLEPEDHSLKRLSHTGSREFLRRRKNYFKSSPDANIHHHHASSSSASVSKTPAMSFKSSEHSTLYRLFAECNKEALLPRKLHFNKATSWNQ